MTIRLGISSLIRSLDRAVCKLLLATHEPRGRIIGLMFHGLARNSSETKNLYSDQVFTVDQLRQVVSHFKAAGYEFTTPSRALHGLPPRGRYAMLTFDDGYYNNHLALDVLKEFASPATFFISTNHVRHQKAFWWDAFYRRRTSDGTPLPQLAAEGDRLLNLPTEEIEQYMQRTFGPGALAVIGDADRPFTAEELREFARQPLVELGNHTANHAILTNYPIEEAQAQIESAQTSLMELAGVRATAIAYPNGRFNAPIIEAARKAGLQAGLLVVQEPMPLPIEPASEPAMRLGRFSFKHDTAMAPQCAACRSPLSLYRGLQRLMGWARGGY